MKILLLIAASFALVAVVALLGSLPVWLLWNWLMPAIFGLTKITWLQSLGLLILSGCLFKSSTTCNSTKS